VLRVRNRFGEWRHLEAHVTDLRRDRHVSGVVLNARDVTERVRLDEQLTQQAFHDSLTGLANRALFRDRLDQALVRSTRSRDCLAVLLVDLDGFKQVNDTHGHAAGDQLLVTIAHRLREAVRGADTAARLGGDEFAVLLDGMDEPGDAYTVAERILASIQAPVQLAGVSIGPRASIGVAAWHGHTVDALMHEADLAMYAAKTAGKGKVMCLDNVDGTASALLATAAPG
jgi:diguanylate cyclase (GGDEF)-like protein